MNLLPTHQTSTSQSLQTHRLIFQNVDMAPPSPENFQNPEKSEAAALNEVASQSPSQIFNDTMSKGGQAKQQYQGSTTALAALVKTDPLLTGQPANTNNSNINQAA